MYKILENNQIIDVMESMKFVKYLSRSKKIITVDEKQANGCISSNGDEIYHLLGTPYNFAEARKTVRYERIDAEEYERLTQQLKVNQELENRVKYLEEKLLELTKLLNK
jgi:hypothetical protein